MGPEQSKIEFKELESRAEYCLSHPEELEPTDTIGQLRVSYRLWHYPSVGDHKSWLLFVPGRSLENSESTFAREVTWKRSVDDERFADPTHDIQQGLQLEPSLEVVDAVVNLKDLNEQLEKLYKIQISICPISKIVIMDGEVNGFQDFNYFKGVRFEWWGDGPPEWTGLTSWAAGMRQFLESHFRQRH